MKFSRNTGSIVDFYEELCDKPMLLTWPLPWPFEAREAFKQRQLEGNGRIDTATMERQWEWREEFDPRLGYARWMKSKLRRDARNKPSSMDPQDSTAESSRVPEVPQTPPSPPPPNEDLVLPPLLAPDNHMKFGAVSQNLRRTFSNEPQPHPLAMQLESRGYYEPMMWQFWRANPVPKNSESPNRHERLIDARKHSQVRLWPLPLPYETYAEFIDRQKQILGRP